MSSDSENIIKTPETPKEIFKHFEKKPSPIELVEISELSPKQCINIGISFLSDDRYEDSFDEEYGSNNDCDTQPDSGNININNKNLKKVKTFLENNKNKTNNKDNQKTNKNEDEEEKVIEIKKFSKFSKLIQAGLKK